MTGTRTRQQRAVGDEMTNANGYTYVKTKDRGWVAKHQLIAEKLLGRHLDTAKEFIKFADGDRSNLTDANILVVPRGKSSARKRLAMLEARRDEIDAEIEELRKELGEQT